MGTLSAEAHAALSTAAHDGCVVRLTCGQLQRQVYRDVDAVLTRLGGRWSRAHQGHLFGEDPAPLLAQVISTGEMPADQRRAEAFFPTPPHLAAEMVRCHTDLEDWDFRCLVRGPRVLEPSAGEGALVAAVLAVAPRAEVVAVEPNASRAALLMSSSGASVVYAGTFERYAEERPGELFDAVVMNPPFSLAGRRDVWIDHVRAAFELVDEGGTLVSVVPSSYAFSTSRRHDALRSWVASNGGGYRDLPDGSFSASGTSFRTGLLWMSR